MVVVDTSVLIAAVDTSEPDHRSAFEALEAERGPLMVPDFVVVETEYLLATRVSPEAA